MLGERRRLKNMQGNNCILDANAVLRFLLQDNEEQSRQIKTIIRGKNCYVPLEVLAEVCYVLEGVYQVTREDIASNFRKLIHDVIILNVDILLRGLEIFDKSPKLDFVDCLLYGYKWGKGIDIVTFDKKLQRRLGEVLL